MATEQQSAAADSPLYDTHIKADRPWWYCDLKEVWQYRDLMRMLIRRDLTAIYKQTVLGPLWFVIQPLITTVIFTIIFGKVANIATDGIPHFVFYMSGTVMWNFFSGSMNQSAISLVGHASILAKVYFPRLAIPLSAVITQCMHFLLNLIMFFGFYLYFLSAPDSTLQPQKFLVLFPLLALQAGLLGLGVGLWVAALTTRYRDLQFALGFLTQAWMYATPIVWPASAVSDSAQWIVWCNPMAFIVETTRWLFTGAGELNALGGTISLLSTFALLVSGFLIFNRMQRTFVDTL